MGRVTLSGRLLMTNSCPPEVFGERIAQFIAAKLAMHGARTRVSKDINVNRSLLKRYESAKPTDNCNRDLVTTLRIINSLGYDFRLIMLAAGRFDSIDVMVGQLTLTRSMTFENALNHLINCNRHGMIVIERAADQFTDTSSFDREARTIVRRG